MLFDLIPAKERFLMVGIMFKFQTSAVMADMTHAPVQIVVGVSSCTVFFRQFLCTEFPIGLVLV